MAGYTHFMDQQVPPGWSVQDEPLTGTFALANAYTFVLQGLSAIEVRNAIVKYWKHKGVSSNEQHRGTNQASRSDPPPQQPAGNSGGAPSGSGTGANPNPYQNAGAGAGQSAGVGTPSIWRQIINAKAAASRSAMQQVAMAQMAAAQAQAQAVGPVIPAGRVVQGSGMGWVSLPEPRSSPKPLPRCEPKVGELIGHRAWSLSGGGLLCSAAHNTVWRLGVPMTDGELTGGSAHIDDHNHSGVWAFKDPYSMACEFMGYPVLGTIWMWGTVIEHERGYRSQFASIRSLDYASRKQGLDLDQLRKMYGVDKYPKCQFCGVAHPD